MIKIMARAGALAAGLALLASPFAAQPAFAQDHSMMHHEQHGEPAKKKANAKKKKPAAHDMHSMSHQRLSGMDHGSMPGMDHVGGTRRARDEGLSWSLWHGPRGLRHKLAAR